MRIAPINQAEAIIAPLFVQIREAGGVPLKGIILDDRIDARLHPVWSLCWRSSAEMAVDLRSTVSWECALT
jgi:hypothetical protein